MISLLGLISQTRFQITDLNVAVSQIAILKNIGMQLFVLIYLIVCKPFDNWSLSFYKCLSVAIKVIQSVDFISVVINQIILTYASGFKLASKPVFDIREAAR